MNGYRGRCPVAPESRKAKRRLRQLLYGVKRDVYRVIYEIDESRKVVCVLTIRHAAWTVHQRRVKICDQLDFFLSQFVLPNI